MEEFNTIFDDLNVVDLLYKYYDDQFLIITDKITLWSGYDIVKVLDNVIPVNISPIKYENLIYFFTTDNRYNMIFTYDLSTGVTKEIIEFRSTVVYSREFKISSMFY